MSVSRGILPFKLIPDSEKGVLTSFAGLPLVVETMRASKVHKTVDEYLVIKHQEETKRYTYWCVPMQNRHGVVSHRQCKEL